MLQNTKQKTALPLTPKDTIDKNEVYVAIMVPHAQVTDARLGSTITIVLVCVVQTVPAGTLFAVTVVYTSIAALMISAVMMSAFIPSLASL